MRGQLRQQRGFAAVVAAQFFSSLADNALLIVAIGMLMERSAPGWTLPALRIFFYLAFVVLAAWAGAVADAYPKSSVMRFTHLVKLAGWLLILAGAHPLVAYALIGLGAASYSPAKYGILPEILPPEQLVQANGWMETATVASIVLGTAFGSALTSAGMQQVLLPVGAAYMLALLCSLAVPRGHASNPLALQMPRRMPKQFAASLLVLWRDGCGSTSLAVTSLFWAVAAVLQFIALRWAQEALGMPLASAALLQGVVAIGMIGGALAAARWVPMNRVMSVLPIGIGLGAAVVLMMWVTQVWLAATLLLAIGIMAGLLLVPMNALLQQRGSTLMHPGQSVAAQNFCECLASFVLLAIYGVLVHAGVSLNAVLAALGIFITLCMLVLGRTRAAAHARV